jgi:hypothetical protein
MGQSALASRFLVHRRRQSGAGRLRVEVMKNESRVAKRRAGSLAAIGLSLLAIGVVAVSFLLRITETTVRVLPMSKWGFSADVGGGKDRPTLTKRVGPFELRSELKR